MIMVNEFYVFLTELNFWAFVFEPSGCGIDSRCSYLNFKYCTWYSGNYRVCIQSKLRIWHDKNLSNFFPLYTLFLSYLNYSRVKPSYILHGGTNLVAPSKNLIKWFLFIWSEKRFPSLKLWQTKSCLPNWFIINISHGY